MSEDRPRLARGEVETPAAESPLFLNARVSAIELADVVVAGVIKRRGVEAGLGQGAPRGTCGACVKMRHEGQGQGGESSYSHILIPSHSTVFLC